MQNSRISKQVCIFLSWVSFAFPQIEFDVHWTPYVTYYLSMVDINTGESNTPIFMAELRRKGDAPDTVKVSIEFEIIIDSEALGVNNETLIKVETTRPFSLTAPIYLTNLDVSASTDKIFDIYGQPVDVYFKVSDQGQIDFEDMEQMFSAIVQTGQLPNGIYTFRVVATPENGTPIIVDDVLNISNPATLQLVSPGGILSDTTINEVYTSYPVLQWESDPCNYIDPMTGESGCEYFIRVAEFKSQEHSSMDQAIESVTRLPLNQSLGFEPIGFGVTTFQYPTDGGDLEPGKVYVWQVRKDLTTTSGTEQLLSDIMSFKVKDFTSSESDDTGADDTTPAGIVLRSLIGDDLADRIFGAGGQAAGMSANGNITLNGETIDVSVAQALLSMGIPTEDDDGNETYRPMEIISVEVSE